MILEIQDLEAKKLRFSMFYTMFKMVRPIQFDNKIQTFYNHVPSRYHQVIFY
jgi:monomeric isocitrate dehydrogenase